MTYKFEIGEVVNIRCPSDRHVITNRWNEDNPPETYSGNGYAVVCIPGVTQNDYAEEEIRKLPQESAREEYNKMLQDRIDEIKEGMFKGMTFTDGFISCDGSNR